MNGPTADRLEWLLWRALALLALAALAVGLTRTGRHEAEGVTRLVWWGFSRDPSIQEFERRNPGVKVDLVQLGITADDPTRLIVSMAGGSPPDLVTMDRFTVAGYAHRGALLPLDDLLAQSDSLHAEDFYPAALAETQLDGHTYAIPMGIDARVLFYNKDILIGAGYVDENGEARPPRTWKELREYANALTVRGEDGKLERVGFAPHLFPTGNSWLYLYSFQNGGSFLSEDGRTCTLAAPENVEALQYMVDVYDDLGGIDVVHAFAASFTGEQVDPVMGVRKSHPFVDGKLAMFISGDWELARLARQSHRINWGAVPAPVPEGKPFTTWAAGWSYAIPRGARHPELAFKLIEFIKSEPVVLEGHRREQSISRARGQIYIPDTDAHRGLNEAVLHTFVDENPNLTPEIKDTLYMLARLRESAHYRPVSPAGKLLWDEQERAFQNAANHVYSVEEALQRSQATVQRELDRIYGPQTGRPARVGALLPLLGALVLSILVGVIVWRTRRARERFRWRDSLAGYAFASPYLFGLLVFTAGPVLVSLLLSLTSFDGMNPPHWVGLANYTEMLSLDPLFWKSLGNTAFMLLGLPLGLAAGLGIALLVEKETRATAIYRTLFYLPAVVPLVAASVLWLWILHPESGILNTALSAIGVDPPNWLHGRGHLFALEFYWSKPAIIIMSLWGVGTGMIIWLAGLKSIPRSLYRAAAIDGARAWQRFRHVTLPMLSPYIFFNLVMGVIATLQIFTQAYVMTYGGPADSTRFFAYYLFDEAFKYFRMGYASALAWILFAIIFVLTLIQLRLSERWVHYQGE